MISSLVALKTWKPSPSFPRHRSSDVARAGDQRGQVRGSVDSGSLFALPVGRKFLCRDRRQLRADPSRLHKQRMNICQRLYTSFNRFLQPFGRVGLRKLDGSHHVLSESFFLHLAGLLESRL
jgi:hypothetical protein